MLKLGKEVTKHRMQFELLADRLLQEEGNDKDINIDENKRKSFYDIQKLSK